MLAPMVAALLAALPGSPATAAADLAEFAEHGLSFDLTLLPGLQRREVLPEAPGGLGGLWTGKLGESEVELSFLLLPSGSFARTEPTSVLSAIEDDLQSQTEEERKPFSIGSQTLLEGPYGYAAYAALGEGPLVQGDRTGDVLCLAGLLQEQGYALLVRAFPALSEADHSAVRAFFENGVRYQGGVRVAEWTDEEARERWRRDAPEQLASELNSITRTKHYIILSNKKDAKLFAKKMEECYSTIREIFPFEESAAQRLMPMFIFVDREQYIRFYMKIAEVGYDHASRSGGHAWRDYYATHYAAPADPVHIHEATHQIFANRLHLHGGGSWFQEGVAEYVETKKNERNLVARAVEKGEHTPLARLFQLESLLHSSGPDDVRGGSASGDNYKQSALLIEFLRESKWKPDAFQLFLRSMGRVPRGDLRAIESVLRNVYGVDVAGLEQAFVEYCKKR